MFLAYPPDESGPLTPIQRFYGLPIAGLDSHFFTGDLQELWALLIGSLTRAWALEGVAFELYPPNQDGSCRQSVRADMLANRWIAEGYRPNAVVFCAPLPRN